MSALCKTWEWKLGINESVFFQSKYKRQFGRFEQYRRGRKLVKPGRKFGTFHRYNNRVPCFAQQNTWSCGGMLWSRNGNNETLEKSWLPLLRKIIEKNEKKRLICGIVGWKNANFHNVTFRLTFLNDRSFCSSRDFQQIYHLNFLFGFIVAHYFEINKSKGRSTWQICWAFLRE